MVNILPQKMTQKSKITFAVFMITASTFKVYCTIWDDLAKSAHVFNMCLINDFSSVMDVNNLKMTGMYFTFQILKKF